MFEAAKAKAEVWWQSVYENAALEFMEEFKAVIASWVEALGPITRIYPAETHPLAHMHNAEVRKKFTHADDPSVPKGKIMLVVRYKNPSDKTETVEKVLGPLSENEYAELKPHESSDKPKTFKNSTVENLLDMVHKFRTLGPALSASPEFAALVDNIEKDVQKAGYKAAEIGEELRVSKSFRGGIHALMQQAQDKLGSEIHTFTKTRRKVDMTILQEDHEEG